MALLSLVSSSELKPGEFKTKINSRILKPLMWQEVEKQDERLRSQFKKIKAGMPPTEVRDLMGVGPRSSVTIFGDLNSAKPRTR